MLKPFWSSAGESSRIVVEGGFLQFVESPTRNNSVIDVFLVRPTEIFSNLEVIQGISDHNAICMEIFWDRKHTPNIPNRDFRLYKKADVGAFQNFLRENYGEWASKGATVEEVWNGFKSILNYAVDRYVPSKHTKENGDPEYYNKTIRKLKIRARKLHKYKNQGTILIKTSKKR